jgi:aryl-alcohol dehydrogenase-like predicted oxidoreductase
MKYRVLGKTNARVSEVGLGTWQLGGAGWGDAISDDDALRIMHRSVELGVNLFDTADVYGDGRSERLIGRFLKESKAEVYVSTKLGRRVWASGGWPETFTLEMARKHTQDSLKNLGVDSIFLQQWHCIPTEMLRSGEALQVLQQLQNEGLIQNWGCSVESVEEGLLCMEHPGCASLQVIFNIFRQKLTDELLPVAQRNNVGILARVPLASGLLSGRFKPGHKFNEADHRSFNADGQKFNVGETFAGVGFEKGVAFAQKVEGILKPTAQASMAQQALRWILDHDAVSSVIPGATKLSQAESNAKASELPSLPPEAHLALENLYAEEIAGAIRGAY